MRVFVIFLSRLYFVGLFGWALLYALFVDRWGWLFLLDSFATWLFAPLPIVLLVALFTRKRDVWLALGAAVGLWVWLFGGLFIPKISSAQASSTTLTVMTYNMLGDNRNIANVIATLRAANADVIGIQELNISAANAIRRELSDLYPYQILDPYNDVIGMGALSRYPLKLLPDKLPGQWVGTPQVLTLDFNGQTTWWLNAHPIPPLMGRGLRDSLATLEWAAREREAQAQTIIHFASTHPDPLIVTADFNTTERSQTHRIMTSQLRDAWREAGWGFGHSWQLFAGHLPFPFWFARIDYIFYSAHWRAESVELGRWDGTSDHQPVVARLQPIK